MKTANSLSNTSKNDSIRISSPIPSQKHQSEQLFMHESNFTGAKDSRQGITAPGQSIEMRKDVFKKLRTIDSHYPPYLSSKPRQPSTGTVTFPMGEGKWSKIQLYHVPWHWPIPAQKWLPQSEMPSTAPGFPGTPTNPGPSPTLLPDSSHGPRLLKTLTTQVYPSYQAMHVPAKSLQSCLTLFKPMDCSSPGFSVHEILQARILEWIAISSSRGLPDPGTNLHLLCLLNCRGILYPWVIGEAYSIRPAPANLDCQPASKISGFQPITAPD